MYHNGFLYEGTGLYGHSYSAKINPKTGKVILKNKMDPYYFGEGLTVLGDKLYRVTLKSNLGFVYDKKNLQADKHFPLPKSGLGANK